MRCAPFIRAGLLLLLPLAAMRPVRAQALRRGESTVRVTTREATITGLLLYEGPQSIVVSASPLDETIPKSDITRLEVRGRSARKGAKILGYTGLVIGGFFGMAANAATCETGSCGDTAAPAAAVGGLALGAIGAVGGAIIGSAFTSWTPVDPARLQPASSRR